MKATGSAVGAIRDVVRRKSGSMNFNNSFGLFRNNSNGGSGSGGEEDDDPYDDDEPYGGRIRGNEKSRDRSGSQSDVSRDTPSPALTSSSVYVEPPEPNLPSGGLWEAATRNVQGKLRDLLDADHEVTTSLDDDSIECGVFRSRSALYSDRTLVIIGNSDGSPAGMWSESLCVRSGSQGGGIFKGAFGSMLPYLVKAKEDKFGVVIFDDVFRDSRENDEIDMDSAITRFVTGWRNHVLNSRATHVFLLAYGDGGDLLVETLRKHVKEMQRHISGIAFVQSTHHISRQDPYQLRKMLAQWAIAYVSSDDVILARLKSLEDEHGCVCLSAGSESSDVDVLNNILASIFASFKARWSGFRVKNVKNGMEKKCYLCKSTFSMRRWRRHCRTCQNACCDKCSSVENTRHEGQVRLCLTCRALPSLIHWSRPRAVRTGEQESVYSSSARRGKMSVNDFELVTVIGRGACGKVLLVQKKAGSDAGHLYAMKVLKKEWVMNKDLVNQTMAERRILQEASHPYIVQLKYAFQNQDKLYMVMEYYSGGSLRHVLRRRGRFSIKRARFYLGQILLAIGHLHSLNILYRDLKLENIVITADGNVACTDFGLSKEQMDDEERTSSFVGTCEYLAPELILKEGYGRAVDWWAFGILAYELIQGDSPFRHNTPALLFEKILKDDPTFSERFTPEAEDLISNLLCKDPTRRLGCGEEGVEEIKSHPFFDAVDWDALLRMEVEVPRPPHRMEDVTDESHLARAIAKMREAREELMPDSPVSLPSSPSENRHFDRFSYQGDGWNPAMMGIPMDEGSDYQPDTIDEDEEYIPDEFDEPGTPPEKSDLMTAAETEPTIANPALMEVAGDGDGVPLSPLSLARENASKNSSTKPMTSPLRGPSSNAATVSSQEESPAVGHGSLSPTTPHDMYSPGTPEETENGALKPLEASM